MVMYRSNQLAILAYRGGKMGVSAVPGSGKTFTLSHLAAELISQDSLDDDQEILVVTLVNSAVHNFRSQIAAALKEKGLLENYGYQVRTLHGLAHDIVKERPDLVGLSNEFQIIDERISSEILADAVRAWLKTNPMDFIYGYLQEDIPEHRKKYIIEKNMPRFLNRIAFAFIKQAKNFQLTPAQIKRHMDQIGLPLNLLEALLPIYEDYQRALAYRGGVDFDDLIRMALRALETDDSFLSRLQQRWCYVLEDEAQDSSLLQEQILRLLVGVDGNWVRVGDPNQAIYETFTTADPEFLIRFIRDEANYQRPLDTSGRSSMSIIRLANRLAKWTAEEHPEPALRNAITSQIIQPVPQDDPEPNPPDSTKNVEIVLDKFSPGGEIKWIVDSVEVWLKQNQAKTVAILAPRNKRGYEVIEELRYRNIDFVELLQTSQETRLSVGALTHIFRYLGDPCSSKKLSKVFEVWRRDERGQNDADVRNKWIIQQLEKCGCVEDYIWPKPGRDWLEMLQLGEKSAEKMALLIEYRVMIQRWQMATHLPVDQLLLTIGGDFFTDPEELALTQKIALLLRRLADQNPDWQITQYADELKSVAQNQRKLQGFSADEMGFDPRNYPGKVVVTTMHKSKGLEWDRVHLMSVNNYNFPSNQINDRYLSEDWYVRNGLNLEAETLKQLEILISEKAEDWYQEGVATLDARLEYSRERLRLLYVGITRAKSELVLTWNAGKKGNLVIALPLKELILET